MTSKLYRQESIENQTQRLFGEVLLLRPISFWVLTIGILIIVSVVAAFLLYGKFARREAVVGFLVPDQGMVRVYAPFNGIIESKEVIDGQQVKKDDVLFKVSTKKNAIDDISVSQQLIEQLRERQQQLENRIKDEQAVFDSEIDRAQSSIQSIQQELTQLDLQLVSLQSQLDLTKSQWIKYQELRERGLILEPELVSKETAYLSAQSGFDSTARLKIAKNNELANLQKELEQLPLRKNNRMQELNNAKTQLQERLIELESNEAYAVKATINGRVTSVQTHPGQTVSSASSLLTIIPENTTLYAELFLPSRAIGFVDVKQKVLLRYDAFPYQRYGLYEGEIIQVAEAVINPNEAAIPLPTQEPVYRVKVAIDAQHVDAHGKKMPLQAGMSVSADIILEERSLGEWLLAPIYSLKGRI